MKKRTFLFAILALNTILFNSNFSFSQKVVSATKNTTYHSGGLTRGNKIVNKTNAVAADYLKALLRFEPWAESVWKDYPKIPGAGYFGDGGSVGNGGIRGNCGIALAYAVLALEYPDAPESQHRIKRIEAALRYAEETHQSNVDSINCIDGKKWGVVPGSPDSRGWQTSLWAGSMGFAAALLEKKLDPKVIAGCKRVVAAEADWLSQYPPRSGYKLDTKAEENAWQSNIVSLACAWMADDPRAVKWTETTKFYLANTYTVPKDSTGPLKKWIITQTLFPSYALENHGFYHPSYQMVAGMSMGDSYLMINLLNPKLAKEIEPFAEHNVEPVWQFLKGLFLESGDLAYPSGLDWSLHSFEHVSYLAWLSTHFKDREAKWAENRLSKHILYRQALNGDGRFVGESCPDGFYREAVEARRIAIAYLHEKMMGFPFVKEEKPRNYIAHYSDAGLIVQRSDKALTTISYGPKTMAMVYPLKGTTPSQYYLTAPNTSSLIGGDGKTTLKEFKKTAAGFSAVLQLNSNLGRKSTMFIESTPSAIVFVEIPSDSSMLPGGEWLLSAIENHALTGGIRSVLWRDSSIQIKERSGKSTPQISSGWVNIDNNIGYGVVPEGSIVYKAATKYNRNGAAEDALVFRPTLINKPRAVIVLPGESAETTAKVLKSVTWLVSSTQCALNFRMPDGKMLHVKVPLSKK